MDAEVYINPVLTPMATVDGDDLRIYYNDQFVDFRDGKVVIAPDESFEIGVVVDKSEATIESSNKLTSFPKGSRFYTPDEPGEREP